MKNVIVVSMLIFAILGSVLAGTLASYTVTLDDLASGSVVGKEFIFMKDGADTFQQGIKIAPTETVVWHFGVRNFDGSVVTETNLNYELTFKVHATTGKSAIMPLTVTVKDENGATVSSCTGTGNMTVKGSFPLSNVGQSASYTVEIYWPGNDAVDINYAGNSFGTTINVSAVASQIASDQNQQGENPPAQSDVKVTYEAETPWAEGGWWDATTQSMQGLTYKHKFRVTITNNSDSKIKKWQLAFILPEQIYQYWDAVMVSSNSGTGSYVMGHPNSYNIDITPGESITFGGLAVGKGNVPLTSVTVDGETAEVVNSYNVPLP